MYIYIYRYTYVWLNITVYIHIYSYTCFICKWYICIYILYIEGWNVLNILEVIQKFEWNTRNCMRPIWNTKLPRTVSVPFGCVPIPPLAPWCVSMAQWCQDFCGWVDGGTTSDLWLKLRVFEQLAVLGSFQNLRKPKPSNSSMSWFGVRCGEGRHGHTEEADAADSSQYAMVGLPASIRGYFPSKT